MIEIDRGDGRSERHTAGCTFVKIFGSPGAEIRAKCYSRQYQQSRSRHWTSGGRETSERQPNGGRPIGSLRHPGRLIPHRPTIRRLIRAVGRTTAPVPNDAGLGAELASENVRCLLASVLPTGRLCGASVQPASRLYPSQTTPVTNSPSSSHVASGPPRSSGCRLSTGTEQPLRRSERCGVAARLDDATPASRARLSPRRCPNRELHGNPTGAQYRGSPVADDRPTAPLRRWRHPTLSGGRETVGVPRSAARPANRMYVARVPNPVTIPPIRAPGDSAVVKQCPRANRGQIGSATS